MDVYMATPKDACKTDQYGLGQAAMVQYRNTRVRIDEVIDMAVVKPEQILFDFANRYTESMMTLDNEILFTSGRKHFPVNDHRADLLLELLQCQQIRVYARKYSLDRTFSQDDYRVAHELAGYIGKRNDGALLYALHIYQEYEPLRSRNEYNALYYPELKAYVRFGDLQPNKLLDMLNEENCNGVMLFRDCVDSNTEDRFFIFMRGIPQVEYRIIMENAQEKQNEAIFRAIEQADLCSKVAFPEWPLNDKNPANNE